MQSAETPSTGGLLALLQSPACVIDAAGMIADANDAWRTFAAAGSAFVDVIDPRDRPRVEGHLRSGADAECRLLDVRGSSRWHLLTLHPVGAGWLCVAADIGRLKKSEAAFARSSHFNKRLLDSSADCFKVIAPDGSLVAMNEAGCRALGVPSESGFGMSWLDLLPGDVRDDGERALATARAGASARFSGRSERDGVVRFWDNALTPVRDGDGGVSSIVCVSRDVTAERETLAALQQSSERLALAAHVGGLGIWDYDIGKDELHCDDGWYRVMRRDPLRPVRSVEEYRPLIHPDDVDRAVEVHHTASELVASGRDYAIEYRILWPTGEIRWVRSAACLINDLDGSATRAIGFVVDITDSRREEMALRRANIALEEAKSELVQQSRLDPLTGIPNRRQLDIELERVCRARHTVTVGMIDVDHFKAFNDRYGHLDGDQALCLIADAVQSVFRHTDTVARFGGEEFVFVLPDGADPSPSLGRLSAAIEDLAIPHDASPFGRITLSCGAVTLIPREQTGPSELLDTCDRALYEAKERGRNTFVIRRD